MFDEAERGTEFNRYVREAKERASEPIDYNSLILWKLASALAARSGSNTRTHEIEDLTWMRSGSGTSRRSDSGRTRTTAVRLTMVRCTTSSSPRS